MTTVTEQLVLNEKDQKKTEYLKRFSVKQRIEHISLMVIFTLLSITGIIQLFLDNTTVGGIVTALGGIENLRLVHRILGIIFTLSMLSYGAVLIYSIMIRRQQPTIMPNIKDFRDIVAEMKHAIGMKTPRPQYHRFDYRQKFEYIGLMFGSVVLIVTGLMLMFPSMVTKVLPGELVAVAARFHGYEATLAVLTILVWHMYSVIFKPGLFPADTSIFTGKISIERMKEEHYLEYKEIIGDEKSQ